MNEIIFIDKPVGISSFGVIRQLRKKTGIKKMGHAGTLDPLASGLMIIGVGKGTKKLPEYIKLDKEYVAEILIGKKTESGDLDGRVIEEREINDEEVAEIFSSEKISATINSMQGILTLPVSAFSAIKRNGVPMYKKARKAKLLGQYIPNSELPIRKMRIYEAELLDIKRENRGMIIKARFKVGSGTYIRSLGEELGNRLTGNQSNLVIRQLIKLEENMTKLGLNKLALYFNQLRQKRYKKLGKGFPATLQSLRRTKIASFRVEDAEQL